VKDGCATACEATKAQEKGDGKPPSVRLVVVSDNPNDPPETWLDRRAGEALAGLEANIGANKYDGAKLAEVAYRHARAMLAEKRRIEAEGKEEK
jgi:hypothetical protein